MKSLKEAIRILGRGMGRTKFNADMGGSLRPLAIMHAAEALSLLYKKDGRSEKSLEKELLRVAEREYRRRCRTY